jgi:glycosyltransferase involved in cell wall biosynthesis
MKLSIITVTRCRSQLLSQMALASILGQTSRSFEWIVINDGADLATKSLIQGLNPDFPLIYRDMPHPVAGFGLAHGRNFGLSVASGEIVTYLDDDNHFEPIFVAEMINFYQRYPQCQYSMATQRRRRDVINRGQVIKAGKEFISPTVNCTLADLITHRQLIDSNGFSHRRMAAPAWNPELRIYVDYDYLLRCADQWGREKFRLNPQVLVTYTQTNEGIIGRSSYQDWGIELDQIFRNRAEYGVLTGEEAEILRSLAAKYQEYRTQTQKIAAFSEVVEGIH